MHSGFVSYEILKQITFALDTTKHRCKISKKYPKNKHSKTKTILLYYSQTIPTDKCVKN